MVYRFCGTSTVQYYTVVYPFTLDNMICEINTRPMNEKYRPPMVNDLPSWGLFRVNYYVCDWDIANKWVSVS